MTGVVKGWCPSAYRPMMSGDGLIVRVKPRLGRMSADQAAALADLAKRFGNGVIDLTSRANVQLRGVKEADLSNLLNELRGERLVDHDADREARRSIVTTPLWQTGDITDRLGEAIEAALTDLPDLPDKMGFALDTGPTALLREVSADVRIEGDGAGGLTLIADGAEAGWDVTERSIIDQVRTLLDWFVDTGGRETGRMARHLQRVDLPKAWRTKDLGPHTTAIKPGDAALGVPFGAMQASDFSDLLQSARPSHIQITPWRLLILNGAESAAHPNFVSRPDDPVMTVSACPGAPACASASVETRTLARDLAGRVDNLHVSGCAKGCAHPKPADVVLVGREGRFDLVKTGKASDTPERTGLTRANVMELPS